VRGFKGVRRGRAEPSIFRHWNSGRAETFPTGGHPSALATRTMANNSHSAWAALNNHFSRMAQAFASWTGHPAMFLLAVVVVVIWGATGPYFNYSDTWQLVINTGTTIVTFLMVFLIQNTQNRDILTVQIKLSELVLAMKGAENRFAALEDLTDEELHALHEECKKRADMTRGHLERRRQTQDGGDEEKAETPAPPKRARKQAAARTKH
jgi:low affinity Fe/Cu permease